MGIQFPPPTDKKKLPERWCLQDIAPIQKLGCIERLHLIGYTEYATKKVVQLSQADPVSNSGPKNHFIVKIL